MRILACSAGLFLATLLLLATGCGGSERKPQATPENAREARNQMADARSQVKSAGAPYLSEVLRRAESFEKAGSSAMEATNYVKALSSFTEARKCYRQAVAMEAEMQTKRAAALAERNGVATAHAAANEAYRTDTRPESFVTAEKTEKEAEEALAKEDFAKAKELFARATAGYKTAQSEAEKFMRAELARPALTAKKDAETAKAAANAAFKTEARPESFVTAGNTVKEAEAALAKEDYEKAKGLFERAAGIYKTAQNEAEAASQKDASRDAYSKKREAEVERLTAVAGFTSNARPDSFVTAANCEKEGEAALARQDYVKARELYARALEGYKAAQGDTVKIQRIEASRATWKQQLTTAEALARDSQSIADLAKVKVQAAMAESLAAKDPGQAAEQYAAAVTGLKEMIAQARTRTNLPKSGPVVAQMENVLRSGNWLQVQWTLGQMEQLIPSDPRMVNYRAKAAALPWPKELSLSLGGGAPMNFVLIPPGSFEMGEGNGKHQVTLTKPFYMGRFEVTQQQWQAVMGNNPSGNRGDKNPVENVSWDTCQDFLAKVNEKLSGLKVLLPTEAQWEYTCRAGSTTRFSHGDDETSLQDYAWFGFILRSSNARNASTHPVGTRKPNAWGLYDMHGNVAEFCSDWFGPYPAGAQEDPQGPASGSERVWRGGSCHDDAHDLPSGSRRSLSPANVLSNSGLRLVLVTEAIADYQAGLVKYPSASSGSAAPTASVPTPSIQTPSAPLPMPTTTASLPTPSTPSATTGPAQPDDWMKWLPPQAQPGFLRAREEAKAGNGLMAMRSWRAMWGNKLRDPTRGFAELEFAELLLSDTSKAASASAEAMKKQQNLREATILVRTLRARNVSDPALLNRLEETSKKMP